MKKMGKLFVLAASAMAPAAIAQQWEFGVMGGGALNLNNSVTGAATGDVGFKPGFSAGGWIGHNNLGRYGGEIRYLFQRQDMKVSSGGQQYTFGGQTHLVHYDFLIHANSGEDRVRPYVAIGGGFKGYRGTGTERAFQPLSNVAVLSRTSEWKPMLSFGAGVKWSISPALQLRVEVRDYVTPFPKDVILPGPGSKISGWVHDLTPLVGLSYLF